MDNQNQKQDRQYQIPTAVADDLIHGFGIEQEDAVQRREECGCSEEARGGMGQTVSLSLLVDEGAEPERPAPPPTAQEPSAPPPPPQAAPGAGLPGFIGRMVRRWGWLAGVYIALQGLGVTLVGALARWGFGSMFRTQNQLMGGMGGFGLPGGWTYDSPPELEGAVMDALGVAPQASPFSGFESFVMGFATIILLIGIVMIVGGLILAYVLWKQGKKGD